MIIPKKLALGRAAIHVAAALVAKVGVTADRMTAVVARPVGTGAISVTEGVTADRMIGDKATAAKVAAAMIDETTVASINPRLPLPMGLSVASCPSRKASII